MSHKSVKQKCLTRALHNSVKQRCPTRVSHQCVNSGCLTSEFAGNVINKYCLCLSTYVSAFGFVGFILYYFFFFKWFFFNLNFLVLDDPIKKGVSRSNPDKVKSNDVWWYDGWWIDDGYQVSLSPCVVIYPQIQGIISAYENKFEDPVLRHTCPYWCWCWVFSPSCLVCMGLRRMMAAKACVWLLRRSRWPRGATVVQLKQSQLNSHLKIIDHFIMII